MDTHIDMVLTSVPWNDFDATLVDYFSAAVDRYIAQDNAPQVFQISYWVSAQGSESNIGFETKEHALEHIAKQVRFCRDKGFLADAERIETSGYNGSPMDFAFRQFSTWTHSELAQLSGLD